MKFSLSWLKDHLKTDASIQEVAAAMTMAGLEVEHISDPSAALTPFSIAKVISAAKHPNADKLQVLQVDTVDGRKEIVCGAPNARAGMTTIYAPIGAYVPGLDVTLVEKPVRGVVSNGMMCSAAELCLSDESDGILDLDDALAVGTPAASVFGAEPIIDFEVTPNRPDWLGVDGIARDLSATGLGTFIARTIPETKGTFPCPISVSVDGTHCIAFAGRVIKGVKNGPSPKWLADKLTSIGLKPISLLVDITNYLCYDAARPMHAYDLSKLTGPKITAGLAQDGLNIETLDGKSHTLSAHHCIISDGSGAIGVGGIMGGESTKVDDMTTDVFLEAALFDTVTTAQAVRELKISSDAGYRFARGVDPQSLIAGIERATALILEVCGGEASEIVFAGNALAPKPAIEFDPNYVLSLSGISVSSEQTTTILTALGFKVAPLDGRLMVTPPSWRRDVDGPADLVEEVVRIFGLQAVPSTPLPALANPPKSPLDEAQSRQRRGRLRLAQLGYAEVISWSFMPRAHAALFGGGQEALVLANPIASELDCMRPTILANLIEAAARNAARGHGGVRLFESGPVYLGSEPNDQKQRLTALVQPEKTRHWDADDQGALFALKADLFELLEALDVPTGSLSLTQGTTSDHWHPGRSARLQLGPKTVIAEFGELHPTLLRTLSCDVACIGFEIRLDQLPALKSKPSKARAALTLSALMPLRRDFAFLVPKTVSADALLRAVRNVDKALIVDAHVFDLYEGKGVPEGQVSMALEVTIQPQSQTLTEAEIEAMSQKIILAAQKTEAVLRT